MCVLGEGGDKGAVEAIARDVGEREFADIVFVYGGGNTEARETRAGAPFPRNLN